MAQVGFTHTARHARHRSMMENEFGTRDRSFSDIQCRRITFKKL
jgi:hypothetical protein